MAKRIGPHAALLFGLVACSSAQPPVETPPANTTETTVATAAASASAAKPKGAATASTRAADLPPLVAKKPGEVVLDMQWTSLQSTLDRLLVSSLKKKAGLSEEKLEDLKLHAISDALRDMVGSRVSSAKALAKEVELTAPIRAVFGANLDKPSMPRPLRVVSVPLRSVAGAMATLAQPARKVGEGVWLMTEPEGTWLSGKCGIVASRGQVAARLICGDSERDVTMFGPYVARNLADKPLQGGDMVVNLNVRPLFDRYGDNWKTMLKGLPALLRGDLAIGQPIFDSAIAEAGEALAKEAGALLDEVHGGRIVLSFDKGMRASASFKWSGSGAWSTQTLAEAKKQQGPAPAMFWRLPANASTASFARMGDPARTKGIFNWASTLADGALVKAQVPRAQRKLITRLVRYPFQQPGSTVSASGSYAIDKSQPLPVQVLDGLIGWNVVGIDQDAKSMKKWLNDFVQTFNNAGLRRRFKKEAREDAGDFLKLKVERAPRELGAGAMAVSLALPAKGKKMLSKEMRDAPAALRKGLAKLDVALHLLVAVDGKQTWVGFGSNRKKLVGLLAAIKANGCLGTQEACKAGRDKLSSVSRLAPFKSGRYLSASYTSFRPLLGLVKGGMKIAKGMAPAQGKQVLSDLLQVLDTMPNGGATPIISQSTIQGNTLRADLNIPKAAVEDVQHVIGGALNMYLTIRPSMPKKAVVSPPAATP